MLIPGSEPCTGDHHSTSHLPAPSWEDHTLCLGPVGHSFVAAPPRPPDSLPASGQLEAWSPSFDPASALAKPCAPDTSRVPPGDTDLHLLQGKQSWGWGAWKRALDLGCLPQLLSVAHIPCGPFLHLKASRCSALCFPHRCPSRDTPFTLCST